MSPGLVDQPPDLRENSQQRARNLVSSKHGNLDWLHDTGVSSYLHIRRWLYASLANQGDILSPSAPVFSWMVALDSPRFTI